MDRKGYLNCRNSFDCIYEFYLEKFDNKKHKVFLSKNELFPLLQSSGYDLGQVLNECNIYLDEKYEVKKVYNKNNELIAVL